MVFFGFVGVIIVWKITRGADGTLKKAQKAGVYGNNREAYIKTTKNVYNDNDDSNVWIEKSPDDFDIMVKKPVGDDIYVTEKYEGDLEIDPDVINLQP